MKKLKKRNRNIIPEAGTSTENIEAGQTKSIKKQM